METRRKLHRYAAKVQMKVKQFTKRSILLKQSLLKKQSATLNPKGSKPFLTIRQIIPICSQP